MLTLEDRTTSFATNKFCKFRAIWCGLYPRKVGRQQAIGPWHLVPWGFLKLRVWHELEVSVGAESNQRLPGWHCKSYAPLGYLGSTVDLVPPNKESFSGGRMVRPGVGDANWEPSRAESVEYVLCGFVSYFFNSEWCIKRYRKALRQLCCWSVV